MTMIKLWIKKGWNICFTKNPYKIKSFTSLYSPTPGVALDIPESRSGVLIYEPGNIIEYPHPAVTLNGELLYRRINGKKRYLPIGIFKEPDRYVYSIESGFIIGPWGLCYDAEKRAFIAESSKEWHVDLKYSPYTNLAHYPAKTELSGIILSCLTNSADGGFYHFLLEAAIKLHQYKSLIHQADHILFNGPSTGWKLKWLKQTPIDINKIIWVDYKAHYQCEQLIFTSRLINDQQISKWCIGALKSVFGITPNDALAKAERIIWISRKGMPERDIAWEEKILSLFPQIESVDLGALTANETINLFAEASHVIGPHGAGLCNIYLCGHGSKILEIFPNGFSVQPCYHRIATICDLEYSAMYLDFENHLSSKFGLEALSVILANFIS